MDIVVAPDSFKGSLTAIQAADTMKKAILAIDESTNVLVRPMADGGEGTLDCLLNATNSKKVPISCTGPLGESISTYYGMTPSGTAVIEGANIAGLIQVPEEKRNPDVTTTIGIGEVIIDALNRGCQSITIGIGGSATNDGGLGMMIALGMVALDEHGNELKGYGKDLFEINRVDLSHLDERLRHVSIKIASDVDNPLCGKRGATSVYGPQKGATTEQVKMYDQALDKYSDLLETSLGISVKNEEGAGAAGGLGFAFLTLGAEMESGAKLVAETIDLEGVIENANLVITGEGQSDEQTLYGKAPGFVASLAKRHDVPVLLISGSITSGRDVLRERFTGSFSIINEPLSLEECMQNANMLLFEQTKQIFHLIKMMKK